MIDQNPPSKFAKLKEAAQKAKPATEQAPAPKRDFKSLYLTGKESTPSQAPAPSTSTPPPTSAPAFQSPSTPKAPAAPSVTGIFRDEQNTAPKIEMPGPGASVSDFRPQKSIVGLPQEQPSYSYKGMPFTQKDAMAQIYKAQKPADLEGLQVSNDPIAMKGLQRRMESFAQPQTESKPQNEVNPFMSYLNIFSSRIANTPADLGEGWAIASAAIERGLGKLGVPGANKDLKATDIATYKGSENWRKFMDEVYPVNKPDRETFLGGVMDGLGQVVPLALTGGTSAMPKVALQATKAGTNVTPFINTGKEIVKRFASKEGVLAGSQIAAPSYKQAKEQGASEDEALRFAIENYAVGSVVENLPIQSMFSRIAKLEPKAPILNIVKEGVVGGGEEAVTEMWQTTYENWSANRIYNANREIFDGIGEAGSIGGAVGFILNAATTALIGKRARTSDPQERETLTKAITELEQKQQQVEQNNDQLAKNVKALELSSLMGEGLGPKSFGSTKPSNVERRKQAGKVVLAKDKNGKTIEITGVSKPQEDGSMQYTAITPGGKFFKVNENDITDVTDVDLDTFNQVLEGKFENTIDQETEVNTQVTNQAASAIDQFRAEFQPFAIPTPMGEVVGLARLDGQDVFVLQDQPNGNVLVQSPGQPRQIVAKNRLQGSQFLPFDQFVSQFGPVPQEEVAPFDPFNPVQAGEEVEIEGQNYVVTGVNYDTNQVQLELQDGDNVDVLDIPLEAFQSYRKPAETTPSAPTAPQAPTPAAEAPKSGAAKLRELFPTEEQKKQLEANKKASELVPALGGEQQVANEILGNEPATSATESPSLPAQPASQEQAGLGQLTPENAPQEPAGEGTDSQVQVEEKELYSEKDNKGRTFTYFSNTTEKDGLTKTKFTFNRSDKDSTQRNNVVTGIPVEKALGSEYIIDENYIPEGAQVVGISEIRTSKGGSAATVTFEREGERFQGEVILNKTNQPTTTTNEVQQPQQTDQAGVGQPTPEDAPAQPASEGTDSQVQVEEKPLKLKYGGKDVDLKGNPQKEWMKPIETAEQATKRISSFIEASNYKGRDFSAFIDRNGENTEVKLREDDGKWNWYYHNSKKPFASFDSVKKAVEFIQSQPFWENGVLNKIGKTDDYFIKSKKEFIQRELQSGNILQDILDGRISANDAKKAIDAVGLDIPESLQNLINQPTTTTNEVQQPQQTGQAGQKDVQAPQNQENSSQEGEGQKGLEGPVLNQPKKPEPKKKPRKKTPEQLRKQEILDREPTTARGFARQWLLNGGKLNSTQSAENRQKGVGIGKGVRDETGMSGREMRSLIGIIDNKNGLSPEVAAERIHETMNTEMADRISVQDLRNALIEVILSEDRKQWYNLQDAETKEDFMNEYDRWVMDQLTPEEIAEFDARQQEESYWEYISENIDELAKQWDEFEQSEAYQQYIEEVYGQIEESGTDGQDQSDEGDFSQTEQQEALFGTDGDGAQASGQQQGSDSPDASNTGKPQSERGTGTGNDSGKPFLNLNPSGNFTQVLNAGRETLTQDQLSELEANGRFLDQIMGDYPQLSQVHENEIFDLINSGADRNKIAQIVANKANTIDFDASKPLNLSKQAETSPVTKRGEIERQIKEIQARTKKIQDLAKKRPLSVLEKAEIAAMTKEVNRLQQQYDQAQSKQEATKPVAQGDLFAGGQKAGDLVNNPKENPTLAKQSQEDEQTKGRQVSQRSAPQKLRVGDEGSIRAQAAARLQNDDRTNPEKLKGLSLQDRNDLERKIIFDFAKENNLWIGDVAELGEQTGLGGVENTIFINPQERIVYKSNNLSNSKDSISNLLEQVRIHNEIFPENQLEVIGFTGLENQGKRPYVEVVMKQEFIPNATQATEQEITAYMNSIGYKPTSKPFEYFNGQFTVGDLRPRNVLRDLQGGINVIDNIITENLPKSDKSPADKPTPKAAALVSDPASQPVKEQLQDVGEKIGGAKKDGIRKYFDKINLNGRILSNIFPKPDIASLLDSGMKPRDVGAIKVAYEFAVQDKKEGPEVIKFYAAYAKTVLAESINLEFKNERYIFSDYGKSQLELRSAAYEAVHDQLGKEYLSLDLSKARILEMTPEIKKRIVFSKNPIKDFKVNYYSRGDKYFDTKEQAIQQFVEEIKANTKLDAKEYKYKPGIFSLRRGGGIVIGLQRKGKEFITLKDGFKDVKEASEYLKSNIDDIQLAIERILAEQKTEGAKPRVTLKLINETSRDRVGKDWRNGKDVSSKEFADTFGFRGVEFGNWVNMKERQAFVNSTYDSLMDMAQILNITPKSISLNGELAIAFGSRGSGQASAHYEPGRKVINLTKTKGLGSLAHEWFHGVDNYFAGFGSDVKGMKAATLSNFKDGVRPEIKAAFDKIYKAIESGQFRTRSMRLDQKKNMDYYATKHEMAARAFENYVLTRLNESGQVNDFLANYVSTEDWRGEPNMYPYPIGDETIAVREAFDELANTLKVDKSDPKQPLYMIIGEQGATRLDQREEATVRMDNLAIAREMEQSNLRNKYIIEDITGVTNITMEFPTPKMAQDFLDNNPVIEQNGQKAKSDRFTVTKITPKEQIRLATGWERGADGKWRYEIQDGKLIQPYQNIQKRDSWRLVALLDNKELLRAVPNVATTPVQLFDYDGTGPKAFVATDPNGKSTIFMFRPTEQEYAVRSGDNSQNEAGAQGSTDPISDFHSTLLHEVQHLIQDFEGFGRGADPRTIWQTLVNNQLQEFAQKGEYQNTDQAGQREIAEDILRRKYGRDFDAYLAAQGEVEARNVQGRARLSPEERRANTLQSTEDVAREDQIFLDSAGVQMSESAPRPNRAGDLLNRPATPTQAKQLANVQAEANRITGNWKNGPAIEVYPNGAAIEAAFPAVQFRDMDRVPGLFYEGKVILNAAHPFHNQPGGTETIILHESIGHFGMGNVINELSSQQGKDADQEYARIMQDVYDRYQDTELMQYVAKTYFGKDPSTLSEAEQIEAGEEYIAHTAQTGVKDKWIDGVIAKIREILRKLGFKLQMADAELRAIIGRASRFVVDGPSRMQVEGQTRPAMMIQETDQTQTPAFKAWFGDSKVVDENGKPLVVYHATQSDFDSFDKKKAGSAIDFGTLGEGFYFTSDPENASNYARNLSSNTGISGGENIIPAFLSIKNPYKAKNLREVSGDNKSESRKFREKLIAKGYDGIEFDNPFGPFSWYVAFEPTQIKSATGNVGTFSPTNPDIRYTMTPSGSGIRINDFVPADKQTKIQNRLENSPNFLTNPRYMVQPAGVETKSVENQRRKGFLAGAKAFFKRKPTLKEKKNKASFRENIQDAMLPGRRMLEAKFGKNIPEEQDFYTKENLAADKVVFQIGQMENKYMNPIKQLTTEIQDKYGVTFEQIEDYLIALHNQERRDELMAKYPEEAKANKDSPEWPTGMTTAEANEIIQAYEAIVPQAERDQLNGLVKDLVNFSLDKRKESGLISEKYYTQLKNQYKNYVPLRGFDDHIEYDVTKYSPLKQAKGRKSKAASPLAYLYADAADAIAHGERNKVFQSMLEFAKKNPDNRVFQIKTTYYRKSKKEDGSQTWIEFSEEEARPDREELEKGTAIRGFNPDIMKDVAMSKAGELTLPVWVNGQRVTIQFKSGNEQLVKALKNTSYSKIEGFLKVSQKLNQFVSSAFTEYSPEFGFVNAARDFGMGGFSIIADDGFDMLAKTTKKYPSSWNQLRGFFWNQPDIDTVSNPYLREFMESGAFTGFSQAKEVREIYDSLANGSTLTIFNNKIVDFLGNGLSAHNKSIENALRFAYFQALRESGMTVQKAAAKAKDVTVNFRRRGNMTSNIGALYAFFNASVQGIERFTRPFFMDKSTRRKAQAMAGTLFVTGFMQGVLFNLIGDIDEEDDELEYDKIPDYTKAMNLILPAPTDSGYFTVPLGYGINVPFALGELLSGVILGKTKPSEAVWRMLTISSDSFSPLGGYDFDDENRSMSQKVAQFATPTYARPILDLAINTNFAGFQIVQQNPWDKGTPNSQNFKPTTSTVAVKAAQLINSATGGDEVVPGLVDINPTAMEYLVRQYGGGPLSFAQKITKTGELLFEGENPLQGDGSRKVPFASRFYQDADNSSATTSSYFKVREQVQIAQDRYEKYLKADKVEEADRFYQKNQPLIEAAGVMEDYDKALKALKKEMNAVRDSDPEYYKELKAEQEAMMKEFNQVYRMIKGEKQIRARDLLGN